MARGGLPLCPGWLAARRERLLRALSAGGLCAVVAACASNTVTPADGLHAQPDAIAPHLLSVPGEALLMDPPAPAPHPTPASPSVAPTLSAPGLSKPGLSAPGLSTHGLSAPALSAGRGSPAGSALSADMPASPAQPAAEASPLGFQPDEVGLASWYGARFHRRRTASGELFDMRAFTAAHPTLPFGSLVCVRSEATGRSVVVRINDRGPHAPNRVIDLSRAAAEALGMVGLGLKPVELFTLPEGEKTCPEP